MFYYTIPAGDCVFLICEGDFSLGDVTTAWQDVREILTEMGWKHVFVNVTALRTSPNTAQLFDLAKLFWLGFPQLGRIAFVVRWDQSRFAKLLEMLIHCAGTNLTTFVSAEQAEAWIMEQSHHKPRTEVFAN